jgi:hypothetical protein
MARKRIDLYSNDPPVDAVRNEENTLSMQPLRMWWPSETKLHIESSPHDSIKIPLELHKVKIETQPYQ